MTDLRKAAEMALECLNYHWDYFEDESGDGLYVLEAKKSLRQALSVPKKPDNWVGLTDEEKGWCGAPTLQETVARVEAKLKEKNTSA